MEGKKAGVNSIDEYIAAFPKDVQKILEELRATIKAAAPRGSGKDQLSNPHFLRCTATWSILPPLKTTSGFIRRRAEYRRSKRNWRFTKAQRARYNSRSINPCR